MTKDKDGNVQLISKAQFPSGIASGWKSGEGGARRN